MSPTSEQGAIQRIWSIPGARLGGILLLVTLVHLIWMACNNTPPIWDMAYHQLKGWKYLEAWKAGTLVRDFPTLSSYYPPLYYLQEALLLRFLPSDTWLALLTNLPSLFLLSWSGFRIASLIGGRAPHWAGSLALLFPLVAWVSRESLLDPALSAWVAAAIYLILRSNLLFAGRWKLALALVVSAGMLTKWTFGVFLLFPLLYAVLYSPNRKQSILNLLDVSILSLPAVLWWYLPNLVALAEHLGVTYQAAVVEGDPQFNTLLGWMYYPRSLSSYYLHLPLTAFWICGFWRSRRRSRPEETNHRNLLWWWLLGGMFLLTIIEAKDPRYVMPLAVPVSILLVDFWQDRPPWLAGILAVAWVQFLVVSFSLIGPVRIVCFDLPFKSDYRTLRQEWVFFQDHYLGVLGPPRQEDWRYRDILARLPEGANVGFAPELPRFHPPGLSLQATRRGGSVQVFRVGHTAASLTDWDKLEWLITKSGNQGLAHLTRWNAEIQPLLQRKNWWLEGKWKLPDGSFTALWRSPRAGVP